MLQAQANLEALGARVRGSRSIALINGMVVRKVVDGHTVQPGMPLISFAFVDYLRFDAKVPVRLAAGLEKGMIVPAHLDVGGTIVDAKVAQTFPLADPVRHTARVKFDLPFDTPRGLGMYAEVKIPDNSVPERTTHAIPAEVPIWRRSLPSIHLLDDRHPSLRIVRVGYPLPDGRVAITSGLSGGEEVILNPPANLVSGK